MPLEKKFNIGDKVITIGYAYYEKKVPIGEIGTVIKIRNRYKGTTAEYNQYKIDFDKSEYKTDEGNLDNLYSDYSIELYTSDS
jgi:hypothetical protein